MLLYLYRLGDMHLVDFNMRKPPSRHLFKILIIAVKQICCIYTNTNCALDNKKKTTIFVNTWLKSDDRGEIQ